MNKDNLQKELSSKFEEAVLSSNDGVHFELTVKDKSFADMSRLESHRLVNDVLKPYLDIGAIHAVSIKIIK